MSEKTRTLKITPSQHGHFHRHLGYIRCWIDGYQAGSGKSGPHVADTLRQIQVWLDSAA